MSHRYIPDVSGVALAETEIGRRLKSLRTRKLLTQEELATKAGLRWQTISDIENGRSSPRFKTLRALAQALEVDPSQLTASSAA